MGYLHISNLTADNSILRLFRQCYALEKVHGTSAHLSLVNQAHLGFFSGGEKHESFVSLFDQEDLLKRFGEIFHEPPTKVVVYGEAYGGKCQGMSATYGTKLRFVAFDVAINDKWLQVEAAARLVANLGLEFVPFNLVDCTQEALDAERDIPSRVGVRNAIADGRTDYVPRPAEGIVIRPVIELDYPNGSRIIAKHKRGDFSERKSKADTMAPDKALVLANAEAVAEEFVTEMRLSHVLERVKAELGRELSIEDITKVLDTMAEDVLREGAGEVEDTKPNRRAISTATVKLFKKSLGM